MTEEIIQDLEEHLEKILFRIGESDSIDPFTLQYREGWRTCTERVKKLLKENNHDHSISGT